MHGQHECKAILLYVSLVGIMIADDTMQHCHK